MGWGWGVERVQKASYDLGTPVSAINVIIQTARLLIALNLSFATRRRRRRKGVGWGGGGGGGGGADVKSSFHCGALRLLF